MKRATREGLPVTRRVCCLRYRVPGFAYCEGSCPLIGRPEAGDRGGIFSPPQSSCMARFPIAGPTLRRPKPRR
ncbi:(2Fe-2S)-binding protein [Lichenifustis flavocetrariae]|uniref:(2Fe-2S)-binding protein n=1 Tax=Lichenifustis flavocetrariae TaxID=2949735 RepID=UPI003D1038D6